MPVPLHAQEEPAPQPLVEQFGVVASTGVVMSVQLVPLVENWHDVHCVAVQTNGAVPVDSL